MRIRNKTWALFLCLGIGVTGMISGCQKQDDGEAAATGETTEVKEETVEFTSKDGGVTIELPGASWKVEEDSENLCTFSSDSGILMLTKSGDAEVIIPKAEEDMKKILEKEGYNSENYEVLEYNDSQMANMSSYRSVIKYSDEDSPYIYGILYGTVIDDKEYMASAMLYSDSEELLEQVKTSVYSFQVLKEKEVVKPEEVTETPTATPEPTSQATPEPTPEATPELTPEATPEPTPQATQQPTEPAPAPVEESITPVEGARTCISPAYVRSGPNNQSSIMGSVVEGDIISITGEIRNWYQINYGGTVAYVCKDYIG